MDTASLSPLSDDTLQQLEHLRREKRLTDKLTADYVTIYYRDLNTDRFEVLKMTAGTFPRELLETGTYPATFDEYAADYAGRYIAPADRAEFYHWFSRENMRQMLADKERAVYRYSALPVRPGLHYFDVQAIKMSDTPNEFGVLIAFRFIDDAIAVERKRQEELQKALDAANLRNEIIAALGKLYVSIFRIDLAADWYDELVSDDETFYLTGKQGKASEKLEELCQCLVAPEYRPEVLRFFDLTTLPDRLQNEETVGCESRSTDGNWHLARFVVKRRNEQGRVTHVLYVNRIISDVKHREETLIAAADAAKRASAAKTEFLSRMAHDIRTPLNAMKGFVALARTDKDPAAREAHLEKAETAATYLESIANDILSLTQIEEGKVAVRLAPVSLRKTINNCAEFVQAANPGKKIDLQYRFHDLPYACLQLDALHTQQILVNLLNNAFRYTPDGGRVEVELYETALPDPGQVRLVILVRDTGVGMTPEFMNVMYERFSRAVDTRVNKVRGTGLGLAVVKNLVDLLGGTLDVKSAPGRGSEFKLTFTCGVGQAEPETPDEAEPAPAQPLHLLVAEDNNLNYEVESELMALHGIQCDRAENGEVCAQKFAAAPDAYDAILMDMQMPIMDGPEATRVIRGMELPRAKKIPIIAVTANAFSSDVAACLTAGMDAHLAKPFDVHKLLAALRACKQ